MAALSDRRPDSVIPLRNLRPEQLSPLLEEEIAEWRTDLDWDFRPSADLVRRFSGMQALDGFVLLAGPHIVGFVYSVAEEGKGLIGDLYVSRPYRSIYREDALLRAVLDSMWRVSGMRRIEAQLMMLSSPFERSFPDPLWFHCYPRKFFSLRLDRATALPPREPQRSVIGRWTENRQDDAARLIAESYAGHIDSRINDQYRSPGGARRFLTNIVQYPGCGAFFSPASFVAIDRSTRAVCGLCLASLVAEDAGHVTQICVSPAHRGTGLGYELLRGSLVALAAHGARTVSLTVTSKNESAIRVYESMGFRSRRDFAAYVWERG
jgi:ribosomal protein S18 acetylase RimI-like enzyme